MAKQKIVIPKSFKCPECGSTKLIGAGHRWKTNPNDDEKPPRMLVQQYRYKQCGKLFAESIETDKKRRA